MPLTKNDLDWFAARLSIAVYDTNREFRAMTITGFQPGAIRAAIDAARHESQSDLAAAMAKLTEARAKAASVPDAIKQVAAQMAKEADDALQELATFTNGGPALDGEGTPLPKVGPAVSYP